MLAQEIIDDFRGFPERTKPPIETKSGAEPDSQTGMTTFAFLSFNCSLHI